MLRNVNDNKLDARVINVPNANRETILRETRIDVRPRKRRFFIENKTQTPDFNSSLEVIHNIYTPNEDNKIYYPYEKSYMLMQETYRECDWTTFVNYSDN
jgi:hypothetical protein